MTKKETFLEKFRLFNVSFIIIILSDKKVAVIPITATFNSFPNHLRTAKCHVETRIIVRQALQTYPKPSVLQTNLVRLKRPLLQQVLAVCHRSARREEDPSLMHVCLGRGWRLVGMGRGLWRTLRGSLRWRLVCGRGLIECGHGGTGWLRRLRRRGGG